MAIVRDRRLLNDSLETKHLALALILGLIARLVVSWWSYGPMALDDYQHVLVPARDAFLGKTPLVPLFRSYLPVWLVSHLFALAAWIGIDSNPIAQVRFVGALCGLISLSTVVSFCFYARIYGNSRFTRIGMHLLALHFLLPFVETRVFGESLSLPFVLLGLVLAEMAFENRSHRMLILGGIVLGFATLLRFQNGICLIGYGGALALSRRWRALLIWLAAGGVTFVIGQFAIDHLAGRSGFSTIFAYFDETLGVRRVSEHQPWFTFFAALAAVYLLPFSAPLFKAARSVASAHWRLLVPAVFFLIVHSIIRHKEERFLIPVIPLFLIAFAAAWERVWDTVWVRRLVTPLLIGLNTILLGFVCTNNSQAGFFEPIVAFQQKFPRGVCIEAGHAHLASIEWVHTFFVWKPIQFDSLESTNLNVASVVEKLRRGGEKNSVVIAETPADTERLRALAGLKTPELECGPMAQASPLIDRVIYRLNPLRNARRGPRHYLFCELGDTSRG